VPVRINRAITLDFIVDGGASDVLIPADVAMTSLAPARSQRATSSGNSNTTWRWLHAQSERFILRELSVGSRVVQNVRSSIGSVKGEPLLGQSFLALRFLVH